MELVKGSQVLVTVDPAFRTRGDAGTVWVDYPNIVRVVPVGGLIYIDDGLISLAVKKIGADAPRAPPSPLEPAPLPARPRSPRHPHSRAHLASLLPQASAWCLCGAGPSPGAEKPSGRGP